MRLGVSTVAYARGLFPEDAFVTKTYAGVNLMVLQSVDQSGRVLCEQARQMQQWIEEGAFDALSKGYLQAIHFDVFDGRPADPATKLIESYRFGVGTSTGDRASMEIRAAGKPGVTRAEYSIAPTATLSSSLPSVATTVPTRDDIHAAMQKMIKTLVLLTSSLADLPSKRFLSMSLEYNDAAPRDYEPQHFGPGSLGTFRREPLVVPLGEVGTGLHAVGLQFRHVDPEDDEEETKIDKVDTLAPQQQQNEGEEPEADSEPPTQKLEYDSDATVVGWNKRKKELLKQAAEAAATKNDPIQAEKAVRGALGKSLSPELVEELLRALRLAPTTMQPPKVSSVKRPLRQVTNDEEDGAMQRNKRLTSSSAPPAAESSRTNIATVPAKPKLVTYKRAAR